MDRMLLPYRRYAEFDGRSSRSEYWLFTLFTCLVMLAFVVALIAFVPAAPDTMVDDTSPAFLIILMLLVLFGLGSFIPGIAVTVRRLHDQDKSGWWYFISFIPYVGSLVLLVMMCIEGTRGDNQYGPDPLQAGYEPTAPGYRA